MKVLLLLWGNAVTPKKDCPARDTECYKSWKKGHFKGSCRSKREEKEITRTKDVRKMQEWLIHVYIIQWSLKPYTNRQPYIHILTSNTGNNSKAKWVKIGAQTFSYVILLTRGRVLCCS